MGRYLPVLLCAAACETRLDLVDPPAGACTPSNCTGCCDVHNTCIAGASQTDGQCGEKGSVCLQCPSGTRCTNGKCVQPSPCDPCSGCCQLFACYSGNEDFACGKEGEPCRSCSQNQHCMSGVCTTCGPGNCPNGCCDFFSNCVSGTSDNDCGNGGNACNACRTAFGERCIGGACR